jgi:hypothetical protein
MTQRQPDQKLFDLRTEESAEIEQLVEELPVERDTFEGLMREYLDTARLCLLNSMPEEYSLNLKLAKELLSSIEDKALKARIAEVLAHLHPVSA